MNQSKFLEEYLVERRGTDCVKWDGLAEKYGDPDLLPMSIADMEFKTSDAIREALHERVEHGVFGYTKVPDSYYEALNDWMVRHHDFPVKKEWVRFTTGCVTALAWMLHTYTQPGDACMILTPVYYPFHNVVTNNKRKLVKVELQYDNGYFTMDYPAIEKAMEEEQVKMLLLCSPHNPAGRVWSEKELKQLFENCKKHHVLIVSDEIHQDLILGEQKFVSAAMVAEGAYRNQLIVVNSASKTFNLATLLHAHIIIPNDELRKQYDEFASGMNRTEVSIMGMIAAEAGYRYGDEWLSALTDVIRSNYAYLNKELGEKLPEAIVCCLEGTYLPMIDLRDYVKPGEMKEFMEKRCKLAVDYGEWFSDKYEGFVRLNLATDPENVRKAVENIIKEARR